MLNSDDNVFNFSIFVTFKKISLFEKTFEKIGNQNTFQSFVPHCLEVIRIEKKNKQKMPQ